MSKAQPILDRHGRPSRRSAAQLGGIVAAAVGGLSLGVLLVNGGGPAGRTTLAPKVKEGAPAVVVAQAPVAMTSAPPWVAPSVIVPSSPIAERREATAPVVSKARQPRTEHAVRASEARVTRAKQVRATGRRGGCERLSGGAQARCAYPEVMAADRRLRRAYAQATRAGVPNGQLIRYRDRWASLRHRADDQPSRVIRAYGEMATDLTRLARSARS